MPRKAFTPVYEETEETIRARMLAHPDLALWRKERGDFIYDAVAAADPAEIQRLEIGMDTTLRDAHAQYAEGPALDAILADIGEARDPAKPNKRALQIVADAGVIIPAGQKLTAVILDAKGSPLQYTVDTQATFAAGATSKPVNVTCTTSGQIGNLVTGSQFILTPTIPGVRSITDLGTTIAGADPESDDEAYKKYDFKVKNPDTGGNKNDLKRWAEEVDGVGAARVNPRWNGNLTTKIVIIGADYAPASAQLVADVQNYMDPGSAGMGEGKAPAGNQVTVVSATGLTIGIAATVTYSSGALPVDVQAAFIAAVQDYLAGIVFTDTPVSIAKIGSLLITTPGVANYTGLTLNGAAADIPVGPEEIAVVGAVAI